MFYSKMAKETFIFRKEWKDAISVLPDEVRLEIYEAIIEYGTSGKLSVLKPMAMLAFNFAKVSIDKDSERYSQISQKRANAAKKRNSANSANAANAANEYSPHGDNDSDSDSDMSSSNEEQKKEPPKGGKKDAATAAARLKERKEDFYNTLIPFVAKYGKEMVRAFFDYWSEPNKSNSKMRYELERTWDLSRRLGTWASRDNQFNHRSNGTNDIRGNSESRAKDAADIIASLAAEE